MLSLPVYFSAERRLRDITAFIKPEKPDAYVDGHGLRGSYFSAPSAKSSAFTHERSVSFAAEITRPSSESKYTRMRLRRASAPRVIEPEK